MFLTNRKVVITSGAFLLSIISYFLYHVWHQSCCDAVSYIQHAHTFLSGGLFAYSPYSYIHTYLYPLYLSLLVLLSKLLHIPESSGIAIFQTATYFLGSLSLYFALARKNSKVAACVFIFMSMNIFQVPYLSVTLSDGFFTCLIIFWLSACLIFFDPIVLDKNPTSVVKWGVLISLMAGLVFATRPAGIWVPFVTFLMLTIYAISHYRKSRHTTWVLVLLSLVAFILPLIPQIIINVVHFDTFSPLPTYDYVQHHQDMFSKKAIRFGAFLLESNVPVPYYYENPVFEESMKNANSILWYLNYPLQGILTLFLKLVELFDFNYIFPYSPYITQPFYSVFTRLASLMIFVSGILGIFAYTFETNKRDVHALWPPCFLWSCLLSWCAVNMFYLAELRYILPMIVVFVVFAFHFFFSMDSLKTQLKWAAIVVILTLLLYLVSEHLTKEMIIIPQ